jgi:hypothetical protein
MNPSRLLAAFASCGLALASLAEPLAVPDLPVPITNNAVSGFARDGRLHLFTFMGLGAGKTWREITNRAWGWREGDEAWRELPPVPVASGRLASVAVPTAGKVYLFGGYTVDEKGGEVSTPEVFCYDPGSDRWSAKSPMPTPVDDTVALVHQDRHIYLVSGWHNTANVALVQVYDTMTDTWRRATDYPGTPVFGHVGGITGNRIVVGGGVLLRKDPGSNLKYHASNETWIGEIDPADPTRITWAETSFRTGLRHYRAAGSPVSIGRDFVVFAGGTERPYNYNGIGYDGQPAEPAGYIFHGSPLLTNSALFGGRGGILTMDHRGFVAHQGYGYVLGGMRAGQMVTAGVHAFSLAHPMGNLPRRKP